MTDLLFGWEEWAALPSLGVAAIPAKIDTGARTSVLHAVAIEVFGPASDRQVRFTIPAAPGSNETPLSCEAPLADRRRITASNGRAEVRPIVRIALAVGEDVRTVDVSLTDRGLMTYRVLLGREALAAFGALVDPSRKYLRPRPGEAAGDAAGTPPEGEGSVSGPDGLG